MEREPTGSIGEFQEFALYIGRVNLLLTVFLQKYKSKRADHGICNIKKVVDAFIALRVRGKEIKVREKIREDVRLQVPELPYEIQQCDTYTIRR